MNEPGYLKLADTLNPLLTIGIKLSDLAEAYPTDDRVKMAVDALNRAAAIVDQCVSIWMDEHGATRLQTADLERLSK